MSYHYSIHINTPIPILQAVMAAILFQIQLANKNRKHHLVAKIRITFE
jgi:hypothetical protein